MADKTHLLDAMRAFECLDGSAAVLNDDRSPPTRRACMAPIIQADYQLARGLPDDEAGSLSIGQFEMLSLAARSRLADCDPPAPAFSRPSIPM
jgi:hypothetical protein